MKTVHLLIPASLLLAACAQGEAVVFDGPASKAASPTSVASLASLASSVSPVSSSLTPSAAPASDTSNSIPGSVTINVPFASQAPLGNWDMPYQEACEEASLILVNRYLNNEDITPEQMDASILAMVDWQSKNGMSADITAAQMVQTAEQYMNKKAEVRYDFTIKDIEAELAKGNPVILPLAGRDIGNPYFSGEGPWYHVLVVTGYDSKNFITNDVGTKRGESYKYRKEVLYNAIHDWTGVKENIRQGGKAMVILSS